MKGRFLGDYLSHLCDHIFSTLQTQISPGHSPKSFYLQMTNMYPSHRRSKTMYSSVPDSAGYSGFLEAQNTGGLTGFSASTASNSLISGLQQWDFMDVLPDQRGFLTPENYSTIRRGSIGTDTVSSQFAWSTVSNTDLVSNSPNMSSFEPSTGHETTPFMQAYDPSSSLQLAMHAPNMSEYTSQQINKWCMDSTPTGDLCQSKSFQNMGSMVPSEPYQSFSPSTNEQWLFGPNQTPPQIHDPTPETFFSAPHSTPYHNLYPSAATTVSITSSPPRSFSDPESSPPPNSASNASDLSNFGILTGDGSWRCAHPGCSSQSTFKRGCDLRKHFNRHRKYLFCRHENCPQSSHNGFSSKKDRARHEAKHNPGVLCEWDGCGKVFSRVDNMKDHVRRIHRKGENGKV